MSSLQTATQPQQVYFSVIPMGRKVEAAYAQSFVAWAIDCMGPPFVYIHITPVDGH